ncbi:protein TonB [Roseovarius sp. MBR-78]|jgi:protein TonB|uniref:TonB family protein n=1 Tax=Roseovarius sp. MBR-78 TaxID=3156460 RepID=UPI0033971782
MIRGLEFAGFVALAAAVHAGIWAGTPEGGGAGGQGGAESVTLAAAAPQMAALVAAWERPVDVLDDAPAPQALPRPEALPAALRPSDSPAREPAPTRPEADAAPSLPRLPAAPLPAPALSHRAPTPAPSQTDKAFARPATPERATLPAPRPDAPKPPRMAALPEIDHRTAEAPRPVRPVARPTPQPAAKPSRPAPAQPKQTARGTGQQQAGGSAKAHAPARLDAATRTSLMGQWGGAIRARIERQKRYPAGTRAQGTAHLMLDVGGDGRLLAVAVTRSSGDARLDAAAVTAVRRARLPAKPDRLPGPRHRFTLPVAFSR